MSAAEDKEEAELNALYPEGTPERRVLDYSRGDHAGRAVPPLLLGAFRMLMGISIVYALVAAVATFSSR